MRISLAWFGWELDFSLEPAPTYEPEPSPEFEPYQDAGTTGSTCVGFVPNIHPGWEKSLNTYDEPSEDTEDV